MKSSHTFWRWCNLRLAISCSLAAALTGPLAACTSFCLQDEEHLIFTKNYDWHIGHGLIIVNKRNIAKRALLLNPLETAAEWVSKYGSVTFNSMAGRYRQEE